MTLLRLALRPKAMPHDAYIQSIRLGTAANIDILNDGLHADPGMAGPIEIVVAANPGALDGVVTSDRYPANVNATVLLAPAAEHRQRLELFRNINSDAAGRFHFENIPPGDYEVFAWDDIEPSAWLDPDFLRKYESRASTIHIAAGGAVRIALSAIPGEPF